MTERLAAELEAQFYGFKASFGGEELKRACASLSGAAVGNPMKGPLGAALGKVADTDYVLKDLAFAAQQYAIASETNPADFDTLYNYGLVLQEIASKLADRPTQQLAFLRQACEKYEAALQLRASSHQALYNWGVGLSDVARCLKPSSPAVAQACLHLASQKYAASLRYNPSNPQALNNWGLVLQDLSGECKDSGSKQALVQQALEKFRAAICSRPDFDRGCYNMGTVYYTYAGSLQKEVQELHKQLATQAAASGKLMEVAGLKAKQGKEAAVKHMFAIAAQYICLAYALQPHKEVYRKSLQVVRHMLPLPFLRASPLTAPTPATMGTMSEAWAPSWFVLDHVSLRSASSLESQLSTAGGSPAAAEEQQQGEQLVIALADVVDVRRCCDPSLPEGGAFWVCVRGRPQGIYLVAADDESADAWVDALLLAHHLAKVRSSDALGEALAPAGGRRGPSLRQH